MINLFDNYNKKTADLKNSLEKSGYNHTTVVLNDDGFLPSDIMSPIGFFTGNNDVTEAENSRFFNEIDIPYFWEIRSDGTGATIYDGYRKKGYINYSYREEDYRTIKEVQWFNDAEKLRQVDMYNKYGRLFGKKTYSDGSETLTTYFDRDGKEVVLINLITNTIQVNYQNKQYIFKGIVDFVIFYLEVANLNTDRIFYNSLSVSFIVASKIDNSKKLNRNNILFWQEESEKMPGNMNGIINGTVGTSKIIVQDLQEYERLKRQNKNSKIFRYLGYIYSYKQNSSLNKKIFILTNSDNIENLTNVATGLPDWEINIAAYTEMSSKLMAYDKYNNVQLMPNITSEEAKVTMEDCAIYLDINNGNEVDNIVRRSFNSNKLVIAFDKTAHNRNFIDERNIIDVTKPELLIDRVKQVSKNNEIYDESLSNQHWASGQTTVEEYRGKIQ